jgi:transcriptional antiterminator NusG
MQDEHTFLSSEAASDEARPADEPAEQASQPVAVERESELADGPLSPFEAQRPVEAEPEPDTAAAEQPGPEPVVAETPEDVIVQAGDADEQAEEPDEQAERAVEPAGAGGNGSQPAPAAEAEELEFDEEEEQYDDRFLPGDWYVVHTYAGYENKVKANLGSRIQSMNMEDKIFDVVIPTEDVTEFKSGRKQVVQRKVFPGYILVRMLLDDDSWYVVRNTPGVTGFVGAGAKPTPLSMMEVGKILAPAAGEERLRPRLEFEVGEVVTVVHGPFANMSGTVTDINLDKQEVTVLVNIFGRETPVTLGFDQVAKL